MCCDRGDPAEQALCLIGLRWKTVSLVFRSTTNWWSLFFLSVPGTHFDLDCDTTAASGLVFRFVAWQISALQTSNGMTARTRPMILMCAATTLSTTMSSKLTWVIEL